MEVSSHSVLKTLPATSELLRRYSVVTAALVNYETDMKETWMKQNVSFHYYVLSGVNSSIMYWLHMSGG
jgi:hypothetical protein